MHGVAAIMRALLLLLVATGTLIYPSEARFSHVSICDDFKRRKASKLPPTNLNHRHTGVLISSIPRGGAFTVLGWTVPAKELAKLYVGFTGINGIAMAVLPTIAANFYGSAFDDSKESLLATLLLERQGDAVSGTSILLYLSAFTEMPMAKSVAWSTVPYVVSFLKFIGTGQVTTLGFDSQVAIAILMSLLLPALNIVGGGWNPTVTSNILATAMLLYGIFGTVNPGQSANLEGLDIAGSPGKWQQLWTDLSLVGLCH